MIAFSWSSSVDYKCPHSRETSVKLSLFLHGTSRRSQEIGIPNSSASTQVLHEFELETPRAMSLEELSKRLQASRHWILRYFMEGPNQRKLLSRVTPSHLQSQPLQIIMRVSRMSRACLGRTWGTLSFLTLKRSNNCTASSPARSPVYGSYIFMW